MSEAEQDATLARRIGRGVGALSLGAAVGILSQFAIVPVALRAWGAIRYGEWVVLSGLVIAIRFADLGLQTYVVNRICASYARGDRESFARELHSALKVQLALVGGLLVALAALLALLPDGLLPLGTIGGVGLKVVLYALALEVLLGIPMGVIGGVYRATGHLPRAAAMSLALQAGLLVAMLALIAWGAPFWAVALGRVGVAVAVSALILVDLRRLHPWLSLRPRLGSWREGAAMLGPGALFLAIPLADYVAQQLPLLVVQGALSGAEVGLLSTHRTLLNLAPMACMLVTNAMWPEITALHARGEQAALARLYTLVVKATFAIAAITVVGSIPLILWGYGTWTGGRLEVDLVLMALLAARTLLWAWWSTSMTFLLAVNEQRAVAGTVLVSAVVTVLASLALVPALGVVGVGVAALVGDLAASAWVLPRAGALRANARPGAVAAAVLRLALLLLAPPALVLALAPVLPFPLLAACALGAFALMLAAAWLSLERRERDVAGAALRGLLPFRLSRSPEVPP